MGGKDSEGLIMLAQKQFYTSPITADKSIDYTDTAGIIAYIHTFFHFFTIFIISYLWYSILITLLYNGIFYNNSKQKNHNKIQNVSTVASLSRNGGIFTSNTNNNKGWTEQEEYINIVIEETKKEQLDKYELISNHRN